MDSFCQIGADECEKSVSCEISFFFLKEIKKKAQASPPQAHCCTNSGNLAVKSFLSVSASTV